MALTVWINTGELSGDMHAAALLTELRRTLPDLSAVGMGGPHLARAGQRNLLRTEDLSVMGIAEVFSALPRALRMLSRIKKHLAELRPAAVILVDAPEFNFRVARAAHELAIPIYYFIPPKVWAWRSGRIAFLRRYVRRLLCILPFERDFYSRQGLQVDYVGNPLTDQIARFPPSAPVPGRIGLMPGSRPGEVDSLMPEFGKAAALLLEKRPELEFWCLRAPNMSEASLRARWPARVPLGFAQPEERYAFMRTCRCIAAASGTATLETALSGVPTVVAYRVSALSELVGRLLIKVPWVSLPNLILDREIFPELLQRQANGGEIAARIASWLDHPEEENAVRRGLEEVREKCGRPGCAARAAALLARDLTRKPRKKPDTEPEDAPRGGNPA